MATIMPRADLAKRVGATNFGDDFKSNLILGDEKGFGSKTALDLYGMTLIKPYLKYVKLGMDNLTGSASLGYIISNQNGINENGDLQHL